jgi:hypothetical protein
MPGGFFRGEKFKAALRAATAQQLFNELKQHVFSTKERGGNLRSSRKQQATKLDLQYVVGWVLLCLRIKIWSAKLAVFISPKTH